MTETIRFDLVGFDTEEEKNSGYGFVGERRGVPRE